MTEPRVKNPKPGWQTTEFWVALLTSIGGVTASASGAIPAKYATLLAGVSAFAYSLARGLAKL